MHLRAVLIALALTASGVFAVFYYRALRDDAFPETDVRVSPPTSLPAAPHTPRPEYPPEQVLDIVLTALRSNDSPYPNAGVATAWAFAAEEIRRRDEADFLTLFTSGLFYPIHRHAQRQLHEITRTDTLAVYDVQLTDPDAQTTTFRIFLTRRFTDPNPGCWLLTALMPHRPGQPPPSPPPIP